MLVFEKFVFIRNKDQIFAVALFKKTFTPTFRFSILAIYLSLFSIFVLVIISFSYIKSYRSILQFSIGTSERVSAIVIDKMINLFHDVENLIEISSSLFSTQEELSSQDEKLISYMTSIIKFDKDFIQIFIGKIDGSFIGLADLRLKNQNYYILEPSKALPKEAVYSLLVVDRSTTPPKNTWYYKNASFQTIATEEASKEIYDPRTRPWYKGAVENQGLFWTDLYAYFFPTNEKGFSIGYPIYSKEKKMLGVVGADVSLLLLSNFLKEQKIGNTGRVFIVDNNGKILIPSPSDEKAENWQEIAHFAYQQFLKNKKSADIFTFNNIKYLSYTVDVPIIGKKDWDVITIVPYLDFFGDIIHTQITVILISLVILLISIVFIFYFSRKISLPIISLSNEINKITRLQLDSQVNIVSRIKEIALMNAAVSSLRKALRSFSRYVPKKIVMQLLEKGEEIFLGGEKKEITIFFSDIKEFTSIAEVCPTEVLMPALNQYFDELSRIILENQGTIDKYIGDSIMAFWGAPVEVVDQAKKACLTALYCQADLTKLNEAFRKENKAEFFTRIGINTGNVIVGNIGTLERMNYTIIGDPVNTASRLQTVNKIYQTKIIISESTHSKLDGEFLVRPLDIIDVKGKKNKIKIFELVAVKKGDTAILATPEQIELCTLFTQGYEAYFSENWAEAKSLFEKIQQTYPQDIPTQIYLDKLRSREN